MFGKNEESSEEQVNDLIQRFNLQNLSDEEKAALVSMAQEHTLVTESSKAITNFAFMKTLVYQNWLILSRLVSREKK